MFGTIVIATGGSASARRAVSAAADPAERFDASVHAPYVVDAGDVETALDQLHDEMCDALAERGEEALAEIEAAIDREVTVVAREGYPTAEISNCVREVDTGAVTMGIRGCHGENRFFIGSVAERVVQTCPVLALTVRQLEEGTTDSLLSDEAA